MKRLYINLMLMYLSNRSSKFYKRKLENDLTISRSGIAYARIIAEHTVRDPQHKSNVPVYLIYITAFMITQQGYRVKFSYNKETHMYCVQRGKSYGSK